MIRPTARHADAPAEVVSLDDVRVFRKITTPELKALLGLPEDEPTTLPGGIIAISPDPLQAVKA